MSAKLQLKESETELKQTQSKFSESSESCTNLKNLLEATQQVKHWCAGKCCENTNQSNLK